MKHSHGRSKVLKRLQLPQPVSTVLRPTAGAESVDPRSRATDWALIAARLDAPGWSHLGLTRRRVWGALLVTTCLAAAVSYVGSRWLEPTRESSPLAVAPSPPVPAPSSSSNVSPPAASSGDLRLVGGAPFERLRYPAAGAIVEEPPEAIFEDGSSVRALSPATLVEPLAMTERDVLLRLVEGTIAVHVVGGGPRKWTIEAGELRVEVVGTRFVMRRTPEAAAVTVEEGAVLARSTQLTDGASRVSAGESVEVNASLARATVPAGVALEALQQKADAARLAGDLHTASRHLEHLVRAFPSDPRAGIAAFQLALVTQQLGAPGERIIAAFERALGKARGQSLRQDCYWRLVLALEAAGDVAGAERRAKESLRVYPTGRYAEQLKRRLAVAE